MLFQASTTSSVWLWFIIRGKPKLLTSQGLSCFCACFQICACFLRDMLCVWAVQWMPQRTIETRAWSRWVLFILPYFLFQSLGKKSGTGLRVITGDLLPNCALTYMCWFSRGWGFNPPGCSWRPRKHMIALGCRDGKDGVQTSRVTLLFFFCFSWHISAPTFC